MEKAHTMSTEDVARARQQAEAVNARLKKKDGTMKSDLGKDAFLKLLVTELRHQDPTQPMADREFISQMAQFSALEQMTNINSALQNMHRSSRAAEAYAMLGKRVEALNPATGRPVEGIVSKIFYGNNDIRMMVNGTEIGLGDIHSVIPAGEAGKDVESPHGTVPVTERKTAVEGGMKPQGFMPIPDVKPQGLMDFLKEQERGAGPLSSMPPGMGEMSGRNMDGPAKGISDNNDTNIEAALKSYGHNDKQRIDPGQGY
jgi:flagellar basal-body rod modification protein FlgD